MDIRVLVISTCFCHVMILFLFPNEVLTFDKATDINESAQ